MKRTLATRARTVWLATALIALALAQTLGAMHRVVHVPALGVAGLAASTAPVASTGLAAVPRPASTLEALFAGHDAEHACDQFDQLTHADIVFGTYPAWLLDAGGCDRLPTPPGWQLAAQAAGFLARGPPAVI